MIQTKIRGIVGLQGRSQSFSDLSTPSEKKSTTEIKKKLKVDSSAPSRRRKIDPEGLRSEGARIEKSK